MIDVLIFVAKESSKSNNYNTVTKKHVLNDLIKFTKKKTTVSNTNQIPEVFVRNFHIPIKNIKFLIILIRNLK